MSLLFELFRDFMFVIAVIFSIFAFVMPQKIIDIVIWLKRNINRSNIKWGFNLCLVLSRT